MPRRLPQVLLSPPTPPHWDQAVDTRAWGGTLSHLCTPRHAHTHTNLLSVCHHVHLSFLPWTCESTFQAQLAHTYAACMCTNTECLSTCHSSRVSRLPSWRRYLLISTGWLGKLGTQGGEELAQSYRLSKWRGSRGGRWGEGLNGSCGGFICWLSEFGKTKCSIHLNCVHLLGLIQTEVTSCPTNGPELGLA